MQRVGNCSYVIVMQSWKNVYLKVTTHPEKKKKKRRRKKPTPVSQRNKKKKKKKKMKNEKKGHGTRSLDVSRTVYLSMCHVQFFSEHIMMDFSSVTAP